MNKLAVANPLVPEAAQSGVGFFSGVLNVAIAIIFFVGTVSFVLLLLTGGVMWITSSGEKGKLEEARGRITHAVIGLVILVASFAFIKLVESVLGISILEFDLGPLVIT